MIEQQARVVRTEGDLAWVNVGGQSGCPACDAGRGCGAGIFGRLLRRRPVEFSVANSVHAQAGQAVTLGIPETLFLKLVWRMYGWPLLAGLAGALLGHQAGAGFGAGPGATDLLSLAGMAGAAGLVLRINRGGGAGGLPAGAVRLLDSPTRETCGGRSRS